MIVQYLSEYIAATSGDAQKIAEFEDRYGYTPKPRLRAGLLDYRYYQLSNKHPNEESRYAAAVRLFSVVFHEPKVTPPRGKQREVVRQWMLWLSRRQQFESIEDLVYLCKRATGVESADLVNSIISQNTELASWQKAGVAASQAKSKLDHLDKIGEVATKVAVAPTEAEAAPKTTVVELLENFKNADSYRTASAKDKRAMKKAFAEMSHEDRVLYFKVD